MEKLVSKIKNKEITLIDTCKGLTNKNYFVNYEDENYMVRIASVSSAFSDTQAN